MQRLTHGMTLLSEQITFLLQGLISTSFFNRGGREEEKHLGASDSKNSSSLHLRFLCITSS